MTMNNLLERTALAIENAMIKLGYEGTNAEPQEILRIRTAIGKAAISAICDEIDEGGIEAGKNAIYEGCFESGMPAPTVARSAISAYLQHLKSATETTKGE